MFILSGWHRRGRSRRNFRKSGSDLTQDVRQGGSEVRAADGLAGEVRHRHRLHRPTSSQLQGPLGDDDEIEF